MFEQNKSCIMARTGTVFLLLFGAFVVSFVSGAVTPSPSCNGVLPCSHACLPPHDKYDFCDTSKSFSDRAHSLVAMLTQKEKIGLIGANSKFISCPLVDAGVQRLGIGSFMWLVETNTAAASACLAEGHCATTFTSPAALAATFNRTVWKRKGEVISTEMRAYNNIGWYRGIGGDNEPDYFIGPAGYGPNINIVRDPRWGRNCEVPSEDPYLAGVYAQGFLDGLQGGEDSRYLKMMAFVKHYTGYSVEANRGAFNDIVSEFDMWDTYLAQFKIAFVNGSASGAMCSYNSINGVPACANNDIMNTVVRGDWNRPDVLFTSDCGAVSNMVTANKYATNYSDASAKALNAGLDLNTETTFTDYLSQAVDEGLTSNKTIDTAVYRTVLMRMRAGLFDPTADQPYTKYNEGDVGSEAHKAINHEATAQSFVLLKNDGDVLPFKLGRKVAVVGPHATTQRELLEDYYGDKVCYVPFTDDRTFTCIPTLGSGISNLNGADNTVVEPGVSISGTNTSGIPAAVQAAENADVVVLLLGLDTVNVETEGQDRMNTTLPGLQTAFAKQILALKKPTVMVIINGGAVAIDGLMDDAHAIVEAFYPSTEGASALADALFGKRNTFGKLPFTMYSSSYMNEVDFTDMSMTNRAGRTYRYYTGEPLYAFGHGLSYGKFNLTCSGDAAWTVSCTVCHAGGMPGDEVLMVYHRVGHGVAPTTHPVPKKSLVDFTRVSLGSGMCQNVKFELTYTSFELTGEKGTRVVYPGQHYIDVTNGVELLSTMQFTR